MWPIAPGSTLILIVAGLLAYMTVTRLHTYSDIETFWATTVQDNPTAGFPRAGLASEYARTGRLHDAAEEFRVAATEGVFEDDDERRALAYDSLGSVYARLNDYAAAVDAYGQAIELFPQSPLIHANLAVAHYNEAHRAQPADGPLLAMALGQARIAVSLDSTSQQNLMVLARIAEGTGELELARETYQRVLRVDASTAEAARAGQALMRLISIDR
jgi:tetratricopeptide (TPR) repeat protein